MPIPRQWVTTAFTFDGYRIASNRGVVRGITVRSRNVLVNFGHVTRLAATTARIIAMQPFDIRHLLRKSADLFSARPESLGLQSVTGAAQRRVANVCRLGGQKAAGRGLHHALVPGVNGEGTVL